MAERSDEAFIIVREFMTRGLGLTGLPLLVYARIYGFCESGSPYFESKAHLGKILGVDTRSVVRAVRKLEEVGLVFEVGRLEGLPHRLRGGPKGEGGNRGGRPVDAWRNAIG